MQLLQLTLINASQIKKKLEKKIGDFNNKIYDTSGLVITTVLNTNISEVENKILDTSSLLTTTVVNTKIGEVENEIPDHAKYITTTEFNKLTAEDFAVRLKHAD